MPSAAPSSSRRSTAVSPAQTVQSHSPSTKSGPQTPKHNRDATRPSIHDRTPMSTGTSVLQKLRLALDQAPKLDCAKYEEYIVQDFERHRVFVDIDVFMRHVLHVPEDWRELWGPTIEGIKRNDAFLDAHLDYSSQCAIQGVKECEFYKPLVDMGNAILDFSKRSTDDSVKPRTPQRYLRNDPKRIAGGVINNLSPDVVAVHDDFLEHISPEDRDAGCLNKSNLTWAQPLQTLEVKPWDSALVDGSCMPRLKVDGRDPKDSHAYPHTPSRFPKVAAATGPADDNKASSAPVPPSCRKRAADINEPPESNRKSQKVRHVSTPCGGNGPAGESGTRQPRTNETDRQKNAYLQVGRYLLEQFAIPAFRSHLTVGLVDRDRIQFYHANHSAILVSSAIEFSVKDPEKGLDKFIAIVIAFSRLSLRDNGILHNLHDGRLFGDNAKLPTCAIPRNLVGAQDGNRLEFGGDEETGPFVLTLGDAISHEPSLAGRSTAVLEAKSPRWKGVDLVVKISWPGSDRVAESEFLDKAIKEAESGTKDQWALNHLPRVLFAQDVVFDSDSTHEKVASLFDNAEFVNGDYEYERRTLRIIVQERLRPLKTLSNVKDVAQVLLDVACVHWWLYDRVGILHRDLSLSNIMYRKIDGKVHGVLTDYDLSSWKETLTGDYTKTSQQRTGTPPFMAYGLLRGTDALHMYRHDLESLFYIMLILATHYEFKTPDNMKDGGLQTREDLKELPYQAWFDQPNYKGLAADKRFFFSNLEDLDLTPAFEDFCDWLLKLRNSFSRGFIWANQQLLEEAEGRPSSTDGETLGGCVDYSALIDPVRNLRGELKGLIIRYDPPITSDSDGAAQADA